MDTYSSKNQKNKYNGLEHDVKSFLETFINSNKNLNLLETGMKFKD